MSIRDLPDAQRDDALLAEARRLASSGKHATFLEVEEALIEHVHSPEDIKRLFNDSPALREEIERLARTAHGIGGGATS